MYHEQIRSTPNWCGEYPRHNTVCVKTDAELPGMRGMVIGHVLLLFSFSFFDHNYQCALIHWLVLAGDEPDNETGMWVVHPEFEGNCCSLAVIHLDCIAWGTHLLPIYGSSFLPEDFHFSNSLHAFQGYFVNRHADHHMYEFLGNWTISYVNLSLWNFQLVDLCNLCCRDCDTCDGFHLVHQRKAWKSLAENSDLADVSIIAPQIICAENGVIQHH